MKTSQNSFQIRNVILTALTQTLHLEPSVNFIQETEPHSQTNQTFISAKRVKFVLNVPNPSRVSEPNPFSEGNEPKKDVVLSGQKRKLTIIRYVPCVHVLSIFEPSSECRMKEKMSVKVKLLVQENWDTSVFNLSLP